MGEQENIGRGFDEPVPADTKDLEDSNEPVPTETNDMQDLDESVNAEEDATSDTKQVESEQTTVVRGFDQDEDPSEDNDDGEVNQSLDVNSDADKEAWFEKLNKDKQEEKTTPEPVKVSVETDGEGNKKAEKDIEIEKYLASIGRSPDVRSEDYDPKLVKYEDKQIKDYNEYGVILKDAGKYYGIIVALIIGLFLAMAIFGQYVLGLVIACILIFIMIVLVAILIGGFWDTIRSSRNIEHKLVSSMYVVPLIAIFAYFSLTIGLMQTLMAIGVLLAIGVVGLVILFVCSIGKK